MFILLKSRLVNLADCQKITVQGSYDGHYIVAANYSKDYHDTYITLCETWGEGSRETAYSVLRFIVSGLDKKEDIIELGPFLEHGEDGF